MITVFFHVHGTGVVTKMKRSHPYKSLEAAIKDITEELETAMAWEHSAPITYTVVED